MALCCSGCVVSSKLCKTRHFAQGWFMFAFFITCPCYGLVLEGEGVVEMVTLDMPRAPRSIGGDDHNQSAMSSKFLCRLLKERIAQSLSLEDSSYSEQPWHCSAWDRGVGREEPSQRLSLQIPVNYWFWYLPSRAQRILVFFCLQSCFSTLKSLTGQCRLSGWWHLLKSGILNPSCHILHLPKAPNFK